MNLLTVFFSIIMGALLPAASRRRSLPSVFAMKAVIAGIMLLAMFSIAAAGFLVVSVAAAPQSAYSAEQKQPAQEGGGAQDPGERSSKDYAAAIAISVATIAAAIAVAVTGSAAIGGITQNPDIFGRSLVFVGLAEGIAIYGLIIAFMILTG